ncbi:hypothetical protein [Marinibactrum halimedae]|uniref:Uncharacterized protein n=1 Tax=Marinibactrum halimedae TaxID=1444977 RepID=A0AA37WKZ9_9GAMM|nr:hypothetical protein [Marinibactrum halimedae]MCD9458751.1 hypothetical protein [Marinibactrum halimedae]GLS25309.1 hypothetical protein GCM10007877_10230 [Marinibactrum halimedae]
MVIFRFMMFLFVGLSLASCSFLNPHQSYEGLGDYRFAGKVNGGRNVESKFHEISNFDLKYAQDKNSISGSLFNEEDYISINLKNAFFNYLEESRFERSIANKLGKKLKGEVVIVANVTSGIVNPELREASAELPGRVVFYSGDMEEGQFANQSFGPVYGPVRWDGNGLTIDLTIIELDRQENEQFSALLSTLSKAGKSYLKQSSPAINILNSLGQSLVSANKDDIMASYTLHLIPRPSLDSVHAPVLRTGDIVIVRKQDRESPIPWSEFDYDHSTGMLVSCNRNNNSEAKSAEFQLKYAIKCTGDGELVSSKYPYAEPLLDHNYVVFSITKRNGGIDLTPDVSFSEFLQQTGDISNPSEIREAVESFGRKVTRDMEFNARQKDISELKNTTSIVLKRMALHRVIRSLQCSLVNIRKNEVSYFGDVNESFFEGDEYKQYCPSESDNGDVGKLTQSQIAYLIREIANKCKVTQNFGFENMVGKSIRSSERLGVYADALVDEIEASNCLDVSG